MQALGLHDSLTARSGNHEPPDKPQGGTGMPAPKRRGAKPEAVSDTAPVTDATATENGDGEDKPKRVRAPKEYKIVSEEMADLVNEFLDTEEFSEGDEITGELISRLRAEGKG